MNIRFASIIILAAFLCTLTSKSFQAAALHSEQLLPPQSFESTAYSEVKSIPYITLSNGSTQSDNGVSKIRYWPDNEWRSSSPEEQGMDSAKLAGMFREIKNKSYEVHSALIIRNGYMVTEAYFPPYDKNTKHEIYSCTKSITSAVFGIAMKEGYIKSTDQKVLDLFTEYKIRNKDSYKKKLTLKHLLMLTPGTYYRDIDNMFEHLPNNYVSEYLDLKLIREPGKTFVYDSFASHMLSAVIQKTTKTTTLEYARKKLFNPLGISDINWPSDPQGISLGGWGIQMLPEDMAKFGYLFLRKGLWNGKQIIPSKWIEESTKKQISTPAQYPVSGGYGYQFWINNKFDGYRADGGGGQMIYILPKYDMVIVFTGAWGNVESTSVISKFVVPAVKSNKALPANKQAYDELKASIEELKK